MLGAALVAGCDAPLPDEAPLKYQDEALLKPQPAPKCQPKGDARKPAADAPDEAARLRKLDYEAQCYRHAEMIARNRLVRLQDTMRAANARKADSKKSDSKKADADKADANKSASNAPADVPP